MPKSTLHWDGDAFAALLGEAVETGLQVAGQSMVEDLSDRLSRPGSGRKYRSKRGDGSTHQASAPGEPPAPDTDGLRDSMAAEMDLDDAARPAVEAGGAALPSLPLEFGAPSINLKPRPFLDPTLRENGQAYLDIVKSTIAGSLG